MATIANSTKTIRPERALNRRAVAAAVIGNALEWYDFTVFGFMTVVIAELFFPTSSEYSSLL
ncbi:TPA: MFS transporter, partial [Burkholderia cenocepacia]